jgi:signal transduction histidine kinase
MKHAESAHAGEQEVYLRAMERLVAAIQELSLAKDLDSVMAIVRHAARELSGADGATFILRDGGQCFYADEDAISPLWKGRRFPMEACISGWSMLNRQPAVIEDIYADARIPHDAYRPTFVNSLAMVPIRTMDPIGAIGAYWANRHLPTTDEVKVLQALADSTAVAMENIQVHEDLEKRVKDRTAALEAANRELDAFTYAVSHDLRAPLRHIAGYADLLIEGSLRGAGGNDADSRAYIEAIKRASERIDRLIENLLTLSRTTRTSLKKEAIDLSALVREIAGQLRLGSPERQVNVSIEEGAIAQGDPGLLQIVFENLLSNAWKFTAKRDQAAIDFGVAAEKEDGKAVFFVRDNGAGFDMAYSGKLFQPFQRLHPEADFPGTGLGLVTVQRIIRKHGGRIWVDSSPGKGTTFFFTLT